MNPTTPAAALEPFVELVKNEALAAALPALLEQAQWTLANKPWLDSTEAAAYLSITRDALYALKSSGAITARGAHGRNPRFHRDDLDSYLLNNRKTN